MFKFLKKKLKTEDAERKEIPAEDVSSTFYYEGLGPVPETMPSPESGDPLLIENEYFSLRLSDEWAPVGSEYLEGGITFYYQHIPTGVSLTYSVLFFGHASDDQIQSLAEVILQSRMDIHKEFHSEVERRDSDLTFIACGIQKQSWGRQVSYSVTDHETFFGSYFGLVTSELVANFFVNDLNANSERPSVGIKGRGETGPCAGRF